MLNPVKGGEGKHSVTCQITAAKEISQAPFMFSFLIQFFYVEKKLRDFGGYVLGLWTFLGVF